MSWSALTGSPCALLRQAFAQRSWCLRCSLPSEGSVQHCSKSPLSGRMSSCWHDNTRLAMACGFAHRILAAQVSWMALAMEDACSKVEHHGSAPAGSSHGMLGRLHTLLAGPVANSAMGTKECTKTLREDEMVDLE